MTREAVDIDSLSAERFPELRGLLARQRGKSRSCAKSVPSIVARTRTLCVQPRQAPSGTKESSLFAISFGFRPRSAAATPSTSRGRRTPTIAAVPAGFVWLPRLSTTTTICRSMAHPSPPSWRTTKPRCGSCTSHSCVTSSTRFARWAPEARKK